MLATPRPASKMIRGPENAATDLRKPAHGPFRTPKSSPRRAPGASPSTLRAALGPPEGLPGAAKPETCKRLQRERQLGPPGQSSWDTWWHPAPPRYIDYVLTLSHSSSRLSVLSGLLPRRTLGVGGFLGLRPLPPTPIKNKVAFEFEL